MRSSIDERFREFHAANPQVYAELLKLARQAVAQGHRRRVGIRMLWEVMRWNLTVRVKADGQFRLNDHYHSRYSRLLMQEPDLAGIFEVRALKSADGVDDDPCAHAPH